MSKKLALDEARADGPAVDDDEGCAGAGAALDDLVGDELLARPALPFDEDVELGPRDLVEDGKELAHRQAGAGVRPERPADGDDGPAAQRDRPRRHRAPP